MSTNGVPPLFVGLVDAAAAFASGDSAADLAGAAPLAGWLAEHRRHLRDWYSGLVGVLLLPVDEIDHLRGVSLGADPPAVGLVGDTRRLSIALSAGGAMAHWITKPAPGQDDAADTAAGKASAAGKHGAAGEDGAGGRVGGVCRVESAVAKRGEDPTPGLDALLALAAEHPGLDVYAEIPLAWGLLGALDAITAARQAGVSIAPKFRTGGLAAELFPTPVELAAVICACRDRDLPFKLTAGLHRAIRHNDPETGLSHHGFVNIMAATIEAADGAEVVSVAQRLASTEPLSLVEVIRPHRSGPRPLWTAFGSSRLSDAVRDLNTLGLISDDA